MKKKQEFLHALKAEAEAQNPDLTFKPKLNEYVKTVNNPNLRPKSLRIIRRSSTM
jgi:hypothetical protein